MAKTKLARFYALSILAWIGAFLLALNLGAVENVSFDLIQEVRLPRAILASMIGLGLSIAGAALQALFTNPLCEPYTLGISSGSALGAVLGISLGFQWIFSGFVGTAFVGAIIFAGVLYLVSLRPSTTNLTLLLTGVILGFLGNSLVALWIAVTDSNGLQGALLWLFGDLSRARMKGSIQLVFWISGLSYFIWRNWRNLDAMLMGEERALALGVDVPNVRRAVISQTSILIAFCVSAGGMIGFVGLVVPHFVRRFVGSLHFHLIPLCGIWGAVILTLADCASRTLIRPFELPVGIVTALIGAPVFLWILLKRRGAYE